MRATVENSHPEIQIRLLSKEDSIEVAKIHRKVFDDTPSARLGYEYCRQLYALYATEANAFGHVLLQDGEAVGFVVGGDTNTHDAISSKLRRQAALSSVVRPELLFSLAGKVVKRTLRKRPPSSTPTTAPKRDGGGRRVSKLFLIGILEKARGTGGARQLLDSFVDHAFSLGFDSVVLNVLRTNSRARKAYEKAGWVLNDRGGESVEYYILKSE
ncbi:MAG TPA: GNAT family N-acetyltransferase [Pyrinomonadaceae bacterium]